MAEGRREPGAAVGAGDPSPPAVERDDFIAAQRRHRAAARGYALLAGFAMALQGLPFGLGVSPLLIGVAVLAMDVVNLGVPVPDPLATAAATLAAGDVTTVALAVPALLLPGSAWLVSLWWIIHRRVLRTGGASVLRTIGAREPGDDDLAGEATRISNRIRGLLTGIHPALERAIGPRIAHPAVLEILSRCGGPRVLDVGRLGQQRDRLGGDGVPRSQPGVDVPHGAVVSLGRWLRSGNAVYDYLL